jgi:hypothetical protein
MNRPGIRPNQQKGSIYWPGNVPTVQRNYAEIADLSIKSCAATQDREVARRLPPLISTLNCLGTFWE